jgi:beta-lactam-binding protein with PASTA domain
VGKGKVIFTTPKAGSKHKPGTKVALTVSRGKH